MRSDGASTRTALLGLSCLGGSTTVAILALGSLRSTKRIDESSKVTAECRRFVKVMTAGKLSSKPFLGSTLGV